MHLTDVFLLLVDMSVAASWVVLVVLAIRLILKKAPKWTHVALWALVAVRLVCPASIESPISLMDVSKSQEAVEDMLDSYVGPNSSYWDIHEEYQMAVDAGIEPIHGGEGNYYVITGESPTAEPTILADKIAPVWVLGMGAMAAYTLVSWLRLRKKVAPSIHLTENIYLCDYIDTPFILGVFRPKIYLPSSMDPDAAAHVLAHERAHLVRRDHWWKPLGFVLLTVHWFNPLLWLAYVLLCRDIEMACDEKVVKDMAVPDKKAYSEALLRCSVSRKMIAACPLAFGEVGVKERVKSVLSYRKPAFWIILVAVIALLIAAVCLLTDPVTDINGQRKFDLPSPNVADLDVQEVLTNIRKYHGLDEENPYVNDYVGDIILAENFDFQLVHIPYFFDQDGKTYLSTAIFHALTEGCTLIGQDEWLDEWGKQESRFLFEHYLNALKYLPQSEIRSMLSEPEFYRIRFVEEGTPGSYEKVIRYSSAGVGVTDGWLIHLEVIPASYENGGFPETGEASIHLFYGEGTPDVDGVIMDAKILEISGNSVLVEPLPGSRELSSADKIWVPMLMDVDPMPPVGEILRITYDGQIMETYPAQIGEVFRIQVVTWEYTSEQADWKEIVHFNDKVSLGIQIPEGWEYERVNTASDGSILEIRFRPAGEEGWVSLHYESSPFGVCGTGLVTENVSFGEYEATQGFYDNRNIWSYILLKEDFPGDYVILNDGADSWLHNANHHATLWKMLETIEISELGQTGEVQEYVTYSQNYAHISVPKLDGWEYEIKEWNSQMDGRMLSCHIRFRPEGEQGWVTLRYDETLQMALGYCQVPEQEITREHWPNYEVNVSREPGSDLWLYIRYMLHEDDSKFFSGTHIAWNDGADGWMANERYYNQLMSILKSVRLAEGVLQADEALAIARSVVENGENLDYCLHRDIGEGDATGIYTVHLFDEGMDIFWDVRIDNEGIVRSINGKGISRAFKYEKEGFGGHFIITLHGDGTQIYSEGGLASYIGLGKWKQDGDIVTITDGNLKNRFRLEGNALVFIAEGSTNFTYIDVADGERFYLQEG